MIIDSGIVTSSLNVSGSFTVITGSSIEFQVINTGVKIGNIITDVHTVTGSLSVSGSITGSLLGTASLATTASFALNAGGGASGDKITTGSITASVDVGTTTFRIISGSSTFLFVSRSGDVGIGTTVPAAKLQVSGTTNVANVKGSGSATTPTIFTVDGAAGRLFSVNDSLSGSLFSVNTIAGLPVMEAFSDNTVRIGQYGQRVLFVSQSRVGIGKETALNATLDISGSVVVTGSIIGTASFATTASFALNAGSGGSSTITFNRQTANYTLALTDAGKFVEMNSGSANVVTVPSSSVVNFTTGSQITVTQYGAGQTAFTTGSTNVTIRSANSWLKINARYGAATLTKVGNDEWYLIGNLNA